MTRDCWHGLAFLAVTGCAMAPAFASPNDPLLVQPGMLRITEIHHRERLRLRMFDDQCIEGSHDGFDNHGRLRLESRPGDIAVDSIASMWVHRNSQVRGMMHGIVLGALVGGIVAWGSDAPIAAILVPFGAGAVGSVLGSNVSRWEPVQLHDEQPDASGAPCDTTRCLPCALERLHPGTPIRVEATAGRYYEGEVDSSSGTGVVMRFGAQAERVERDEILRLSAWYRVPGKGAAVGSKYLALAGGIAGIVLGGLVSNICFECNSRPNPVLTTIAGGLMGGLMGAALGGGVGAIVGGAAGASIHNWVQLYP